MAECWWSPWVAAVAPYGVLTRLFGDGALSADEFELLFLRLYKDDPTDWPEDLFDVLDELFSDVDAYCADPALRQEVGGIDGEELRVRAQTAYSRLEVLAGGD